MKDMVTPGEQSCPFEFNFDEKAFEPGDVVSYRVNGSLGDMPFVGVLLEVHDDHVILAHDDGNRPPRGNALRGTRESRPLVNEDDALR